MTFSIYVSLARESLRMATDEMDALRADLKLRRQREQGIAEMLTSGMIDRETLGREAWGCARDADAWDLMHEDAHEDYRRIGERLFAMGRASVEPRQGDEETVDHG